MQQLWLQEAAAGGSQLLPPPHPFHPTGNHSWQVALSTNRSPWTPMKPQPGWVGRVALGASGCARTQPSMHPSSSRQRSIMLPSAELEILASKNAGEGLHNLPASGKERRVQGCPKPYELLQSATSAQLPQPGHAST